ncbi:MAG: hypothetical protein RLY70_2175 [Planctomycetota bacterium]
MHETTRRFCCRAGFLLGCVLPTLLVAAWVGYQRTSWFQEREREAWRAALVRYLGVDVSLEAVTHPEPQVTRLEKVVLTDPETGRRLAAANRVELGREDDGWVAFLGDAEVPYAQLSRFEEIAQPLLWRRAGYGAPVWQVVVGSLQLTGGPAAHTLLDVRMFGETASGETAGGAAREVTREAASSSTHKATHKATDEDASPRVRIDFRLAGLEMREPARLVLTRRRDGDRPATDWEFETGPRALPAAVLSTVFPPLGELGDECQISGRCAFRRREGGWDGEAQARFAQVDLDRAITRRFPHKLSGIADVAVSRLRWRGGRVVEAAGAIESGGGVVSHSLLAAAASDATLQWSVPATVLDSSQPYWKYRQLSLAFELSAQGLQLTGHCQGAEPGTIIASADAALAREGSQPWLSAVAVVRWLAPQNEIQVPASLATEGLLRTLPLPPTVGGETAVASPPRPRLRLK